jgi:hypothetical protein
MQRRLVLMLSALALMLCAAAQVKAADDKAANVTGTWVISQQNRNGNTSETTLKLKQDGEKVTGTVTPPARGGQGGNGGTARTPKAIEIEDGKITSSGELTFKTTRENTQGNKMVSTYHGKIEGDTIKGTIESEGRNGQTRSREFEAKRKSDTEEKPKS